MTAPEPTIICDQAIFTSVRTPTGEGYRIIAASAGLKADERRQITRLAPSHGSLCQTSGAAATEGDPSQDNASEPRARSSTYALSFYALAEERYCVGLSFAAGAEHTGRGGARVYTHCAVFDAKAFVRFMFNPFLIGRAMIEAGLDEPQLKPPARLAELTLTRPNTVVPDEITLGSIGAEQGAYLLARLFEERVLVVNTDHGWTQAAEGLWLSLPGPFRSKLSLSAGLKFSTGRSHHLQLLSDEKGLARTRVAGQRAEYIDTTGPRVPATSNEQQQKPAWQVFVSRHWAQGDWDGLARRTSLPFCDVTPTGRERVGRLYNTLDELPQFESMRLISTAAEFLKHTPDCPMERGIVNDLLTALRSTLITRVNTIRWPQDEPLWKALVRIWRGTAREKEFAHQLVVSLLRTVSAIDPVSAAELALDVAAGSRHTSDSDTWSSVMVEVLARWADTVTRFATEDSETKAASSNAETLEARLLERSRALAARWQSLRPDCSLVARVLEHCSKSSLTSSVTKG